MGYSAQNISPGKISWCPCLMGTCFLAHARTDSYNYLWQSLGSSRQVCLSDFRIQAFKTCPSVTFLCMIIANHSRVCVAGEGVVWEGRDQYGYGSCLCPLGPSLLWRALRCWQCSSTPEVQCGISSRLCCALGLALHAHSISAQAFSAWHRHLLVVSAVLELLQEEGKGLLEPCSTSKNIVKGQKQSRRFPSKCHDVW